jgi:uncharacterized protein YlxW (UPF0749 family)
VIYTKLKKNFITSWQLSVATASLFLGFLLSIQFKSQAEHRASANIPSRRIEDMTNLLKESEEKRDSLEKSILSLKEELTKLKKGSSSGDKREFESKSSLVLTGFTPVSGPGIIVILNDSKEVLEKGENPANGIVHNEDLLKIANELNAAGAEAISINGNRLIATSEISCAGPTILINKNRVAPPFEIVAIGKPETMISALEMRGGILETIKFFGLESKIERKDEVTVPAYTGSIDLKYSKPIMLNTKGDM